MEPSGGALNKIERAHQMYRDGQHEEALAFYTQALSMAKTNPQKIALHSNRAACYLKLHRFNKAAEECTLVLELDQNHTGALMLRAQTLVTLKEYTSALFDVNRLMELNPSSDVYQNLQTRLKTQLSLAPIPECEEESLTVAEDEEEEDNEPAIALADKKTEATRTIPYPEAPASQTQSFRDLRSVYVKEWESAPKPNVHAEPVIRHANQKTEATRTILKTEALASRTHNFKDLPDAHSKEWETIPKPKEHSKPMIALADKKAQATGPSHNPEAPSSQTQSSKDVAPVNSRAWEAIPKPKGHSNLDYSRWNKVEDDSSEDEEDEDEESLPRYRFRVRTVGVRPVK